MAETKDPNGPVHLSKEQCGELFKRLEGEKGYNNYIVYVTHPTIRKGFKERIQELEKEITENTLAAQNLVKHASGALASSWGAGAAAPARQPSPYLEEVLNDPRLASSGSINEKIRELQTNTQKIVQKLAVLIKDLTEARNDALKPNKEIIKRKGEKEKAYQEAARSELQHVSKLREVEEMIQFYAARPADDEIAAKELKPLREQEGPLQKKIEEFNKTKEESKQALIDYSQALRLNLSLAQTFQDLRNFLEGKAGTPGRLGSLQLVSTDADAYKRLKSLDDEQAAAASGEGGTNPKDKEHAEAPKPRPRDLRPLLQQEIGKLVADADANPDNLGLRAEEVRTLEAMGAGDRKAQEERAEARTKEILEKGARGEMAFEMYKMCQENPKYGGGYCGGLDPNKTVQENIADLSIRLHKDRLAALSGSSQTPQELREEMRPYVLRLVDVERRRNALGEFTEPPPQLKELDKEWKEIMNEWHQNHPNSFALATHQGKANGSYVAEDARLLRELPELGKVPMVYGNGIGEKTREVPTLTEPTMWGAMDSSWVAAEQANTSTKLTSFKMTLASDFLKYLDSDEAMAAPSFERDDARVRTSGVGIPTNPDNPDFVNATPVVAPKAYSLLERKLEQEDSIRYTMREMEGLKAKIPAAIEMDREDAAKHDRDLQGCYENVNCHFRLFRKSNYDYMATGHTYYGALGFNDNLGVITRKIVDLDPSAAGIAYHWYDSHNDATRAVNGLVDTKYEELTNGQRAIRRALEDNYTREIWKFPLQNSGIYAVYDSEVWQRQASAQAAVYMTAKANEALQDANFDYKLNLGLAAPTMMLNAATGGVLVPGFFKSGQSMVGLKSVPELFGSFTASTAERMAEREVRQIPTIMRPFGNLDGVVEMARYEPPTRDVVDFTRMSASGTPSLDSTKPLAHDLASPAPVPAAHPLPDPVPGPRLADEGGAFRGNEGSVASLPRESPNLPPTNYAVAEAPAAPEAARAPATARASRPEPVSGEGAHASQVTNQADASVLAGAGHTSRSASSPPKSDAGSEDLNQALHANRSASQDLPASHAPARGTVDAPKASAEAGGAGSSSSWFDRAKETAKGWLGLSEPKPGEAAPAKGGLLSGWAARRDASRLEAAAAKEQRQLEREIPKDIAGATEEYWRALHSRGQVEPARYEARLKAVENRLRNDLKVTEESMGEMKAELLKVKPAPTLAEHLEKPVQELAGAMDSYWRSLNALDPKTKAPDPAKIEAAEKVLTEKHKIPPAEVAKIREQLKGMPVSETRGGATISGNTLDEAVTNLWTSVRAANREDEALLEMERALRRQHGLANEMVAALKEEFRGGESFEEAIAHFSDLQRNALERIDLEKYWKALEMESGRRELELKASFDAFAQRFQMPNEAVVRIRELVGSGASTKELKVAIEKLGEGRQSGIQALARKVAIETAVNSESVRHQLSALTRGMERVLGEAARETSSGSPERVIQNLRRYGMRYDDAAQIAGQVAGAQGPEVVAQHARAAAEKVLLSRDSESVLRANRALSYWEGIVERKQQAKLLEENPPRKVSVRTQEKYDKAKARLERMEREAGEAVASGKVVGGRSTLSSSSAEKTLSAINAVENKSVISFVSGLEKSAKPEEAANAAADLFREAKRWLRGLNPAEVIVASDNEVVLRLAKSRGFKTVGVFSEEQWGKHWASIQAAGKSAENLGGVGASAVDSSAIRSLCDYCMGIRRERTITGKLKGEPVEAWKFLASVGSHTRFVGDAAALGRFANSEIFHDLNQETLARKYSIAALDEQARTGKQVSSPLMEEVRKFASFGRLEAQAQKVAKEEKEAFQKATEDAKKERFQKGVGAAAKAFTKGILAEQFGAHGRLSHSIHLLREAGYDPRAISALQVVVERQLETLRPLLSHMASNLQEAVALRLLSRDSMLKSYADILAARPQKAAGKEIEAITAMADLAFGAESLAAVQAEAKIAVERAMRHIQGTANASIGGGPGVRVFDLERIIRDIRSSNPDSIKDADVLGKLRSTLEAKYPGRTLRAFVTAEGEPNELGRMILEGATPSDLKVASKNLGVEEGEAFHRGVGSYEMHLFAEAAEGAVGGAGGVFHEGSHIGRMRLVDDVSANHSLGKSGNGSERARAAQKALDASVLGGAFRGVGPSEVKDLNAFAKNFNYQSAKVLGRAAQFEEEILGSTVSSAVRSFLREQHAKGASFESAFERGKALHGLDGARKADFKEYWAALNRDKASANSGLGEYSRFRSFDEVVSFFWTAYGEVLVAIDLARTDASLARRMQVMARLAYAEEALDLVHRLSERTIQDLESLQRALKTGGNFAYDAATGNAVVKMLDPAGNPFVFVSPMAKGMSDREAEGQMAKVLQEGIEKATKNLRGNPRMQAIEKRIAMVENKLGSDNATVVAKRPSLAPQPVVRSPASDLEVLRQSQDAHALAAARRAFVAEPANERARAAYVEELGRTGYSQPSSLLGKGKPDSASLLQHALAEERDYLERRIAQAVSREEVDSLRRLQSAVAVRAEGVGFAELVRHSPGGAAAGAIAEARAMLPGELERAYQRHSDLFGGRTFEEVKGNRDLRRALSDLVATDKLRAQESGTAKASDTLRNPVRDLLVGAGMPQPDVGKVRKMIADLGELHSISEFSPEEARHVLLARGWSEAELGECLKGPLCEPLSRQLARDQIPMPSPAMEALMEKDIPGTHHVPKSPRGSAPEQALAAIEEGLARKRAAVVDELARAGTPTAREPATKALAHLDERIEALRDPATRKRVLDLLAREEASGVHGAFVHPATGEITTLGARAGEDKYFSGQLSVLSRHTPSAADIQSANNAVASFLGRKGKQDFMNLLVAKGVSKSNAQVLSAYVLGKADAQNAALRWSQSRNFAAKVAELRFAERMGVLEAMGVIPDSHRQLMRQSLEVHDRIFAGLDPLHRTAQEIKVSNAVLAGGWHPQQIALCRASGACGIDSSAPAEILARVSTERAAAESKAAARVPAASRGLASEEAVADYAKAKLASMPAFSALSDTERNSVLKAMQAVERGASPERLDATLSRLERVAESGENFAVYQAAYSNAAELLAEKKAKGLVIPERSELMKEGLERSIRKLYPESTEDEIQELKACLQSIVAA